MPVFRIHALHVRGLARLSFEAESADAAMDRAIAGAGGIRFEECGTPLVYLLPEDRFLMQKETRLEPPPQEAQAPKAPTSPSPGGPGAGALSVGETGGGAAQ